MIKVEFSCPKCGKEQVQEFDFNVALFYTSCSCGTYFSIYNTDRVRVYEAEKEEFYDMCNILS